MKSVPQHCSCVKEKCQRLIFFVNIRRNSRYFIVLLQTKCSALKQPILGFLVLTCKYINLNTNLVKGVVYKF